ncbi:MAG: S8 family serine peptidase [Bacteroidales bacterium]|nr:S8 family serine peptidase [Bacteroidales bacterium]
MNDLLRKNKAGIILALLLIVADCNLRGQDTPYNYFYRVYFSDKGNNHPANYLPSELLSEKALYRRAKSGIPVPDYSDIPVSFEYLSTIKSLGFEFHCTSKWMNTALFKTQEEKSADILLNLPFVSDVKVVKKPGSKSIHYDKLDFIVESDDTSISDSHIIMLNGSSLHSSGYNGSGILIAVLDGGFLNADQISSLVNLRGRKGIKYTYDFVKNNPFVFDYHVHGTAVLSVLAGQIDGYLRGTAPGADYLLLRTEDTESETAAEEDFWIAGAEFADSTGADIISSSLGYYNFDDPSCNYTFSDLDGNTTFITRAADIAASKGILVVNSAGNERNKEWLRIIAPSDGDSVIAAGAVGSNEIISTFSSAGPSADGRIKPDNVALGVSVFVQTSTTGIEKASGTSFSCPVLSGMTACLMQAVPEAVNSDIITALRSSADRYLFPDSLYGYGIPDLVNALSTLQDIYLKKPLNKSIAKPNPTTGDVEIIFKEPPGKITVEIFTLSGKIIFRKDYKDFAGRNLVISALNKRQQGLYFIRLISGTDISLHKIIKLPGND